MESTRSVPRRWCASQGLTRPHSLRWAKELSIQNARYVANASSPGVAVPLSVKHARVSIDTAIGDKSLDWVGSICRHPLPWQRDSHAPKRHCHAFRRRQVLVPEDH